MNLPRLTPFLQFAIIQVAGQPLIQAERAVFDTSLRREERGRVFAGLLPVGTWIPRSHGPRHSWQEVTQLLQAWCNGDRVALERLMPLVHDHIPVTPVSSNAVGAIGGELRLPTLLFFDRFGWDLRPVPGLLKVHNHFARAAIGFKHWARLISSM